MLIAARQGRGRLVHGLLRAGADLQATDQEGRTGLSLLNIGLLIAAKEGSAENINDCKMCLELWSSTINDFLEDLWFCELYGLFDSRFFLITYIGNCTAFFIPSLNSI